MEVRKGGLKDDKERLYMWKIGDLTSLRGEERDDQGKLHNENGLRFPLEIQDPKG